MSGSTTANKSGFFSSEKNKKGVIALTLIFIILIIDQIVKIWIKTHFYLGEDFHVFNSSWFIIHFTENNGMAFGMEFAGKAGKLALSLFRIIAAGLIAWYIIKLIREKASLFLIITISLIFAGAFGNIIDGAFYGIIFNESTPFDLAVLFPDEGGYAPFLFGRVVDMFYFPIINTTLPSWVPFWGGEQFTFFQPVFNIADASITIGVLLLLIFYRKLYKKPDANSEKQNVDKAPDTLK